MTKVNYDKVNLCVLCDLKFPKSIKKCTTCGRKLRTTARTSWKNKTRMRFKCSSCDHLYGDCACVCCLADEIEI
jgi:ribosomal protein L34E